MKRTLEHVRGFANARFGSYLADDDFVKRSAANPLARRVKLADLEDNMDLRRTDGVTEKDLPRLQKYVKAWRFLSDGQQAPDK